MKLVEQHIVKKGSERYKVLDRICFLSKNLYNASLYVVKQEFLRSGKWIRCQELTRKFTQENQVDFRALSGSSAQQVQINLDNNLKSYFKAIKAWKRDNKKFTGCPKFPKYLDKVNGRFMYTYSYANIRHKEGGMIHFPKKDGIKPLKTKCEIGSVKQVRFIPKIGHYVIEVVYEVQDTALKSEAGIMGIDLGLGNLAACVSTNLKQPVIINGKPLKSINQYFNKKKADLQSKLEKQNGKKSSKRLNTLILKRNNKIKDYLHGASKKVVELAVENNITTIVVGYNEGWKEELNFGKINNQNFYSVPFLIFLNQLRYKSERQGLRFISREESYTSKCSAFDLEEVSKHEVYVGKRLKRGLFRTRGGNLLNADINGAWNILRKETGDASLPSGIGFGFNPVKIIIN